MNYGSYSPHLDKPLTTAEATEMARLESKFDMEEQLLKLAARLSAFCRKQYPRWATLNPILPGCYYGAWSMPIARWPWSRQPWPLNPPQLALTHGEWSLMEALQDRHDRPAALACLDHNPNYTNGWISRYERLKENETRPDLLPLLAAETLKKFEAELPEKEAYLQRFCEDDQPAYLRHLDSLRKNAAAFRQHLANDLAPPAATGPADAKAASAGPTRADRWAGLLINYTLADLNTLLVVAGLLDTAEPLAVANDTKPGQWVAVAAALKKGKRTRADKAALYRAFSDTYGPAVGSLSSFSRAYNEANEAAQRCYSRALSWLG